MAEAVPDNDIKAIADRISHKYNGRDVTVTCFVNAGNKTINPVIVVVHLEEVEIAHQKSLKLTNALQNAEYQAVNT